MHYPVVVYSLLLCVFFFRGSVAIKCYECSDFDEDQVGKCPGLSSINFGNKYDACIIYRDSDSKIVFQKQVRLSKAHNLCTLPPQTLKETIKKQFNKDGDVMCCRSDQCNHDIPSSFAKADHGFLFLEDFNEALANGDITEPEGGDDDDNDQGGQPEELTKDDGDPNGASGVMAKAGVMAAVMMVTVVQCLG